MSRQARDCRVFRFFAKNLFFGKNKVKINFKIYFYFVFAKKNKFLAKNRKTRQSLAWRPFATAWRRQAGQPDLTGPTGPVRCLNVPATPFRRRQIFCAPRKKISLNSPRPKAGGRDSRQIWRRRRQILAYARPPGLREPRKGLWQPWRSRSSGSARDLY